MIFEETIWQASMMKFQEEIVMGHKQVPELYYLPHLLEVRDICIATT